MRYLKLFINSIKERPHLQCVEMIHWIETYTDINYQRIMYKHVLENGKSADRHTGKCFKIAADFTFKLLGYG